MHGPDSVSMLCVCPKCSYLKGSRRGSESRLRPRREPLPTRPLPETPPTTPSPKKSNGIYHAQRPRSNSAGCPGNWYQKQFLEESSPRDSPRYPHWFGRPNRSVSKGNSSPSKQELMERLEAVHTGSKELSSRLEFLQKRLRYVSLERDKARRERDAAKQQLARKDWEDARLFVKWLWPDLQEDTGVDEVLADDVPDHVATWNAKNL
ncbi:hypothetical protein BKA67DRAFT_541029 [Truncatella angustata]|uniref:Uncharacterized protein n=1 Tax=Truncatella angustata TaxID=152316 RepID=A0A9P8RHC7_9PEZI|nr:uncharacterized protein BKA67DRAFT_541029 [Truncatella angustata]KAH6646038.1 hypothetical protein BKA67DRAFT_541029 [Truncatella angustata]